MKISDMIRHFKKMQREHGNLEVEKYSIDGRRVPCTLPIIDHKAILDKRERLPRFASSYAYREDYESRKGEKVCRI